MSNRIVLRRLARIHQNRCGLLLGSLCVFILVDPHVIGTAISTAFLGVAVVALIGLALSPFRPGRFWPLVFLLLAMAVAETLVELQIGKHWMEPTAHATTALFTAGIIMVLLQYVLDRRPITADKVFGAVSAYVLIAVLFATLFSLLQLIQPNAFHVAAPNDADGRLDWSGLMYFSFTVLTSTGFGEITPVTHQARSLIVVEQVLGVMYVAFLIARLANMYQDQRDKHAIA
jgi:Ion channel